MLALLWQIQKTHMNKPKQGRPPKPADQKTKPHSIRLTAAERELLNKAGIAEFRKWLQSTAPKP